MSEDVPADGEGADDGAGSDGGEQRREVVVPDRVYRVVTVFSTLFAVALVVLGMVALDAATAGAETRAEVDLLAAAAGVGGVVAGAAVYAFASRFRAAGMGNPKDADGTNSE